MNLSPEELFQAREKRVSDAVALKEPDRVPVMTKSGFFPAFYAGITCREAMYDSSKVIMAWSKFLEDFEPDMADNPFSTRFIGALLDALGCKQLLWPGNGLGENAYYQFVEGEHMAADDYDELIYDTTGFLFRTYWPRIFTELEGLEKLPPLNDIFAYYMGLSKFSAFGTPEVQRAMDALKNAALKAQDLIDEARAWVQRRSDSASWRPLKSGAMTGWQRVSRPACGAASFHDSRLWVLGRARWQAPRVSSKWDSIDATCSSRDSRSNRSSAALAAAQASGLPV